MAYVRYWIVGNRAFAYTPHRQSDGKFYAIVYAYDKDSGRSTAMIKKRAFARRKKAKAKAYEWYQKRKDTIEKLKAAKPVKPVPTKVELTQKKLPNPEQSKEARVKEEKT